ncbi:MAG: shikimate kinase [Verrucomicrobiota bacterium JB023]|nr:shikimate kinase [Verrucomicrobiota bacterium JB023]
MLKNLILIGFMGTGKSTIGRELGKVLGYPIIDTDARIVEEQNCSIAELFELVGEQGFRETETDLLRRLLDQRLHKHIISTGGGIILRPENRKLLKELGFVIWLVADPDTILERTSRNRERPLLQTPNPKATIENLLNQRVELYRETAHLSLETTGLDFDEITTGIIESARYHYSHLE